MIAAIEPVADWLGLPGVQPLWHQLQQLPPAPIQPLRFDWLAAAGIELDVWRGDLLHPQLSGNKFFKLKYNLLYARAMGWPELASFGGAYSNHLHALAAAGQLFGFATHGWVRGESLAAANPTLTDARAWGMSLDFLSRSDYRLRQQPEFLARLRQQRPQAWLIPEGGSNELALYGLAELAQSLPLYDQLLTAVGSGATLAGLSCGLPASTRLLGISVIKGGEGLLPEIQRLQASYPTPPQAKVELLCDWHQGGYGKVTQALRQLMLDWAPQLPLEPFYTAKVCLALQQLVSDGYFPRGSRLLVLHTGGLQGVRQGAAGLDLLPAAVGNSGENHD